LEPQEPHEIDLGWGLAANLIEQFKEVFATDGSTI
jgi:hypothetical protein